MKSAGLGVDLTEQVSERDHVMGDLSAPLTLVEYGDYECGHCATAHGIVSQVQERIGERMRFVFRNFPLTQIHPHAQHAAEAAEIAARQQLFWEMHDTLFENHGRLTDENLTEYAERVGLEPERFRADLSEHTAAERVREDFHSGLMSGVNGTPTFFINGKRHDGGWDLETLLKALESDAAQ